MDLRPPCPPGSALDPSPATKAPSCSGHLHLFSPFSAPTWSRAACSHAKTSVLLCLLANRGHASPPSASLVRHLAGECRPTCRIRRSPRVPLRLPCTSTPRPDRQVPRERLYLYHRRGSDKYPYNKCTSTIVFGIAKNVKYPFEMTRSASSNDPKYLFEATEYHYHRTLERLHAETSGSSMNHVRLPFLVDSPNYHEMGDPISYRCRVRLPSPWRCWFHQVPLRKSTTTSLDDP